MKTNKIYIAKVIERMAFDQNFEEFSYKIQNVREVEFSDVQASIILRLPNGDEIYIEKSFFDYYKDSLENEEK